LRDGSLVHPITDIHADQIFGIGVRLGRHIRRDTGSAAANWDWQIDVRRITKLAPTLILG